MEDFLPKLPFMRFYPADYLLGTRALTDTEKAIWMDILCYMWLKPSNRGRLDMHIEDMARMVGRDRLTLQVTLDSLKNKEICDMEKRDDQTFFVECRRMVRDQKQLKLTNIRVKRFNASINASINAPINGKLTPKKSEDRSQKTDKDIHPAFDEFWKAYPRKVGKDAAFKAWDKKKPPLEAVLKALTVQRSCDQWQKEGGQFVPHPATWLNQGRWKDEINGERKEVIR